MKRILVFNGHPDPRPARFCGALSDAYEAGARSGGWETRRRNVGDLPLAAIESLKGEDSPAPEVAAVLDDIRWANRLVIVFPLWFDEPPDMLRALFGHAGRRRAAEGEPPRRHAHLVVTMELPAFAYRSLLRPGGRSRARALWIPGVIPEDPVLIGCVGTMPPEQRRKWLETVRQYGERSECGTTSHASVTRTIASVIERSVTQWRSAR